MKIQTYILAICFMIGSVLFPAQTYAAAKEVKIEDPVLEKAIREKLKLAANQTLDELAIRELTSLRVSLPEKIKSLKGLETAYNLRELILPDQSIKDVNPLRNLYQLQVLDVSNNDIKNICGITGLNKLLQVNISNNSIADIGCFSRLTSLKFLFASNNNIQDITSLTSSPLQLLDIENNPITDISTMQTMNELRAILVNEKELNEKSKELLVPFQRSGVVVNPDRNNPIPTSGTAVIMNGNKVKFDYAPLIETGTTLVQFRPLFEKLGYTIEWNNETRTIQAHKDGVGISLQVDSSKAELNGHSYDLPIAPKDVNGNVFVPIRFVAEASKYVVTWDDLTKTIHLMPLTREVVSSDGNSQIEVSGKWINKDEPKVYSQMYMTKEENRLVSNTYTNLDFPQYTTLKDVEKDIMRSLESYKIKDYVPGYPIKVNGMDAIQFSYLFPWKEGVYDKYIQTIIQGTDQFFRIFIGIEDPSKYEEMNEEYQKIIQTFQERKTMPQLIDEKFGQMSPKERLLDAAHYYRKAGFFASDKHLTNQQFDQKFEKVYKDRVNEDWDPFDSKKDSTFFADLFVLLEDKDRTLYEELEMDVIQGNNKYVETLKKWSTISRGAFNPTDISEQWATGEGPVTVSFTLNGQKKSVHPVYSGNLLDPTIIEEINIMIKDTGYQFAAISDSQNLLITMLTADEKSKIEKDRSMYFAG
ncbi:stalk domain-containing protein [Paenibacillus sp. KN14-4R]|uniref:stalk domain-containing protein n=1 Tax=Paenibacillus sp. KN14-4R TaxID=3445773 RepID=UPI003F9F9D7D